MKLPNLAPFVKGLVLAACAPVAAALGRDLEEASTSPARLPLDFVENGGQWPGAARFAAHGGAGAHLLDDGIVLPAPAGAGPSVRIVFEGARGGAGPEGLGRRRSLYNFYVGDDPARWRSGVAAFGAVVYRSLHEGIDLVVRSEGDRLEYDLVLAPGADLSRAVFRCEGAATGLHVEKDGALVVRTPAGALRHTRPRTFEVSPSGEKTPIECAFRVLGPRSYGFEAPGRDPSRGLVVDPGIEWSTFLGGSGPDFVGPAAPARDGSGDVFVGGTMNSPDFPGFFDPAFTSSRQARSLAFVARLGSDGSSLVYATFLGGWHSELVSRGLAVDAAGSAVLCGQTFSPDFPTTPGAVDSVGENKDGFVFRVDPLGALVFSTYLGGLFEDFATSVAYAPSGEIVVGGVTASNDFPTTPGAFDTTYNVPNAPADGGAHGDMFVSRLGPDGTEITYSTFLGGPSLDYLEDLAVGPDGVVTVAGWSSGNNVRVFVPTAGAFDSTWNGSLDGVLARLSLDGAGSADLRYATLVGGSAGDELWRVALDPSNPDSVTVAGRSWSSDYPTTAGVVRPDNPPFSDLFPNVEAGVVTRFRFAAAGGGALAWSTYHHGSRITGLAVNEAGEAIVAGPEAPWDLATTRGAFDRTAHGAGAPGAAFVARLSADASRYAYQSFFGGSGGEADNLRTSPHVAHVAGNTVILSGQTQSNDFPVTALALDPVSSNAIGGGASNEGFVTRMTLEPDASGDLAADPPALQSPADGTVFRGGLVGRIEWSEVTDPSGVESYEFQVAVRADFDKRFLLYRGAIKETEALLPPSVGTSGGLPQATFFWRVRTADRAGNLSAWSPARTFSVSPSAGRPAVSFVQVHPSSGLSSGPVGGSTAYGMMHLTAPAPPGGAVARITAHHDRTIGLDRTRTLSVPVGVPEFVVVREGATSAPFEISTSPVAEIARVTLVATIDGAGTQAGITVTPSDAAVPALSLALKPGILTGGNPARGVVTIGSPAPPGGLALRLLSSHPEVASVGDSVTIAAGETTATFPIATFPVAVAVDANVVVDGHGASYMRPLYVRPPGLPVLGSMTIAPAAVAGGGSSGGSLSFSGPIPLAAWPAFPDGVVRFSSSDPSVAAASPSDEVVLAGASSHAFRIFTRGVPSARAVTITAEFDSAVLQGVVNVGAVTGVSVSSLRANVTSLRGGEGGVATVALAQPAPVPLLVTLSSDRPDLFSALPADVVVSTGSTTASFAFVTRKPVAAATTATLRAAYGGSAASLALSVSPSAAATPPVMALALVPSRVDGGSPSTGTVTLGGAAPAGGAVVQLFSGNPAVAAVPGSVTVPAGASSASFPVATSGVAGEATVPIEALLHLTASGALTVTGAPPTPGTPSLLSPANGATRVAQPVTLDWSDVAHAATYLVQLDDSSTFSSPLVREGSVAASRYTTTGLAARRHFWRVRAVNSAGVAGPWSATRRFDPVSSPAEASLSSVSASPSTVSGGGAAQGSVVLTAAAPSGGAVVALSSGNPAVVSVPPSVTVAGGATSGAFLVSTSAVASTTSVSIAASYAGASRTASLTVAAERSGPLPAPTLVGPANDARFSPGQTIAFDWSDVAGAARYRVEIDDSDQFSAPLVQSPETVESRYATASLPTRRLWWRVRAIASSGEPGAWSGVRRIEVKN